MNQSNQPAVETEAYLRLAQAIAGRYAALPQVEAVALAGSLAAGRAQPGSDIDLYVYCRAEIPLSERALIARGQANRAEVDNRFWEPGDEWLDTSTGIHVDVMFRDLRWIEDHFTGLLEQHQAWVGYTTCLWHNVLHSQVLFDRQGWLAGLQDRVRIPYPDELMAAIVAKNHPILRHTLSSYRYQLERALQRGDRVSLNHRVAAVLASYFDILFAINRQPHPGEKRLLEIAQASCPSQPREMAVQLEALLAAAASGDGLIEQLDALLDKFDAWLRTEGYQIPVWEAGFNRE